MTLPVPFLNPSPPSAAYTFQWTMSALVQAMACRLFGTKPLLEAMLAYCYSNFCEIWIGILWFSFKKMHFKMSSARMAAICPGVDELMSKGCLRTIFSLAYFTIYIHISLIPINPHWIDTCRLTHCGLVTPYYDINLGQYWFRKWLAAWQHQPNTWTFGDLLIIVQWHSSEGNLTGK